METGHRRNLGIADAMIMVAASAIGLAYMRATSLDLADWLPRSSHRGTRHWIVAQHILSLLPPLLTAWTPALLLVRLLSTLPRDRRQGRDLTVTSQSPDARQPTLIGPPVRVRVFQDVNISAMHGHAGRGPRPLRPQDGLDLAVRRDLQEAMTACGGCIDRPPHPRLNLAGTASGWKACDRQDPHRNP